jgi:hypothetical protein
MKLRILVGLLSMSMLGLWACEDSAEKEAEKAKEQQAQEAAKAAAEQKPAEKPAEPAPEPPKPEITPKQVCETLVAAAKAKPADEAKLVANGTVEFGSVEGAKESLQAYLVSAPWVCGEGKVDGDKGQIPLTAGTGKKAKKGDLPMVKSADGWKVDAAVFLKAHPAKKAKAVKKPAKAKKGKA